MATSLGKHKSFNRQVLMILILMCVSTIHGNYTSETQKWIFLLLLCSRRCLFALKDFSQLN
ncbi:hypothetical protein M758_2G022900 [Ceratodon purpureus]|nr:hypothetical protein M758_2G022900 [Ceratodon purpureus]